MEAVTDTNYWSNRIIIITEQGVPQKNTLFCISSKYLSRLRTYSTGEERANTLSHAAGILLGMVAGYILLSKSFAGFDLWKIGSVSIYLFGMLSCYMASTLYHGCKNELRKRSLQKLDHASIYVHIAGTYSPFTLIILRENGAWGWTLFTFIWLAAIIGIILSFRKTDKHSHIETVCYVIMGCAIFIAFKPLVDTLNETGGINSLYWLIAGGISYIIGAVFYSLAKMKYMHTVFHFFVLGGSICHIIAIYIIL